MLRELRQILFVLGLGVFWGAGPAINKAMGFAGVPVTHIVVAAGFGVGVALLALQWARGERLRLRRPELLFGLACSVLTSAPFIVSLFVVRHVPVALFAVITATSPLWTYGLALALRRDRFSGLRLAALVAGFGSCALVIVTRASATAADDGQAWLLATLSLPLLYAFYNNFAGAAWPEHLHPFTAGMIESFGSGLIGLPLALLLDPAAGSTLALHPAGYALLLATIAIWVLERVCFFSMIREFGPVTTVQATYVGTPATVVLGILLFDETPDAWLWLSLVLLMVALWLNARATKLPSSPAPVPETATRPANARRR